MDDAHKFLNFDNIARSHAAHMELQSRPIRPSFRGDQGRSRCYADWCEALRQQWCVRVVVYTAS